MQSVFRKDNVVARLFVVVFSAMIVQLLIVYWGADFILYENFYGLHAALRLGVPIVVILFFLKIPFSELGVRRPHLLSHHRRWMWAGGVVITLGVALIRLNPEYIEYYSVYSAPRSFDGRLMAFGGFSLFTISTLPGWEFLHRSFLLFGVFRLIEKQMPRAIAETMAILLVACFEVIFHFSKPPMEAVGMLVGSPVLSLIALRTGSLWIPLLGHLYVELLFILLLLTV